MMNFSDPGQIRLQFDQLYDIYIGQWSKRIKQSTEDWLLEKQESYQGDQYTNQLEHSFLYLNAATSGMQQTLARYLHEGKPKISKNDLPAFNSAYRDYYGQIDQIAYLQYLHKGSISTTHKVDPYLKSLRDEFDIRPIFKDPLPSFLDGIHKLAIGGDIPRYIDELEYNCKFFHGALTVSETYLNIIYQMPDLGLSCKKIPLKTLFETVNQRITFWAGFCLGLINIQVPDNMLGE
jgi:hypothetical protein